MHILRLWYAGQVLFILIVIVKSQTALENNEYRIAKDNTIDEFIGCLYENVCNDDEICHDDKLFGRCLNSEKAELAELKPDDISSTKISLIKELLPTLFDSSWFSILTQCRIRSLILSVRFDLPLNFITKTCKPEEYIESVDSSSNQYEKDLINNFSDQYEMEQDFDDDDPELNKEDKENSWRDIENIDENKPSFNVEFDNESQDPFYIRDESIPFFDVSSDSSSMTIEQITKSQNGKNETKDLIWLDFASPLKSQQEAKDISQRITNELNADSNASNFTLTPDRKHIEIETENKGQNATSLDLLNRLKRFADSNMTNGVHKYGVGLQKNSDLESKSLVFSPLKIAIIAGSTLFGILVVVLAVSMPLIVRKSRGISKGSRKLDITNDYEDDKCLTDHTGKVDSASEFADSLGPLNSETARQMVNTATKSAKSLFADTSDYFSSFSIAKTKDETCDKNNKPMKKQSSNTSIASSNSSQRTGSTSSWSSEPPKMDIDITTGHLILEYLETHLKNQARLEDDWRSICGYEAEDAVICEAATRQSNLLKNRPGAALPYEQSRVKLRETGADYINASLIYDLEPRNPSYIITQTPMTSTMKDFWQMVWEQSSVTIISLDRVDNLFKIDSPKVSDNPTVPIQYWPDEGWELCGPYEIHLVSEHMWCGTEYVVRSFYLKNLETNETRTVTQFHFLAWSLEKPTDTVNTMLEFRRRVNKSFRGKGSPIIVHCPDGCGASGTYLLLDLVLNRLQRGIKELNVAASLEHLRDQRLGIIQSKDQFHFVLSAIAEEVNALLKANTNIHN